MPNKPDEFEIPDTITDDINLVAAALSAAAEGKNVVTVFLASLVMVESMLLYFEDQARLHPEDPTLRIPPQMDGFRQTVEMILASTGRAIVRWDHPPSSGVH